MERARKKKSKVPTVTEGNTQLPIQKRLSKLASGSSPYSSSVADKDLVTCEFGRNSISPVIGAPIKKLIADEMSKEIESNRRSPSVIARLMGLDGFPAQPPLHGQHKGFSETYQRRITVVASERDYEHRRSRINSIEQDKFKDVYEVPETQKTKRSAYPAKTILNSDMEFVRHKLVNVKCPSTDEKLRSLKEVCVPLDLLDTSKDQMMKFLNQPDSLFAKHLIDLQVDASTMQCSCITVMKPLNSHKYESSMIGWKSDTETLGNDALPCRKHHEVSDWKHHDASRRKHHDGTQSKHHCAKKTAQPSRIQLDENNECATHPIRIVVLKPNLEKAQNATKSASSPCSSHGNLSDCKKIIKYENKIMGNKTVSNDGGTLKPKSRESRERSKEISGRLRDIYHGELIDLSSKVMGYAGDESSYCASGSESEVTVQNSTKSFHWSNRQNPSPSHSTESSLSREAKKRLSESWTVSRRYQHVEAVGKGGTLGEMLAIPDWEMWPENLDRVAGLDGRSDRFGSNERIGDWDSPLGISSGDDWKDCIQNSSPSRSVPALSIRCGDPKTRMQCEALDHGSYLRLGEARKQRRSKTVDGISSRKEFSSIRKLRYINKSQSSRNSSSDSIDSLEEKQFNPSQMEINLGKNDSSEQKSLVTEMPISSVTGKSLFAEAEVVDGHNDMTVPSESPDKLSPEPSACFLEYNHSASPIPDDLKAQEPQIGTSVKDEVLLQCQLPEPQSPEISKDAADHPSPVSVLEVQFQEDVSYGSECFERVSADLQELRMQLKLLKMESGSHADPETLNDVPQLLDVLSQENDECWESSYLVDVLLYSQLDDASPGTFMSKCHTPECPLNPTLFDNLEHKYRNQTRLRSDRRLLFDHITSGLVELVKRVVTRKLGPTWPKGGVEAELHEWVSSEERRGNERFDERMVDREMQWLDSGDGVEEIGRDMENKLLCELILEVANM